jgi:SAM-dependent methyltransferase
LEQGWDAYGADVEYAEQGNAWLTAQGYGERRLRTIVDDLLPFDDVSPFDILLSYQVLEHVPNLSVFIAGLTRIGREGTVALHVCPGAWHPLETHMQLPLVHWLPKGPLRRHAIKWMLRAGLGRNYFNDLPLDERAQRFARFSEEEVFYRPLRVQLAAFERAGHQAFAVAATKLRAMSSRLPEAVAAPLGSAYGRLRGCYIETRQVASAAPSVRTAGHADNTRR